MPGTNIENVITVTDATRERHSLRVGTPGLCDQDHDPAKAYVTDIYYDLNDLVTEVRRDNGNADMPNTRHKVKMEYSLLDIVTEVLEYYESPATAQAGVGLCLRQGRPADADHAAGDEPEDQERLRCAGARNHEDRGL